MSWPQQLRGVKRRKKKKKMMPPPPRTQAVDATMAWLRSSWHIQVPLAWLETCVAWVQEEGGGGDRRLTPQQINQQVLDQWLLADLRDLGHPVLPGGLSRAQKTELSGTFCVQVDSLLDISQPAYGQLQKVRGKDCTNEEVTAVTQATQRPWEARPTRMLLLQVTDGVQNLEAMEYQPISALNLALRPGAKLQLRGQMVCRLGVLLLGPQNVQVMGGEVEDLVDRNSQGRVLCRALGLPAEEPQNAGGVEEHPAVPQQANGDMEDLDLDDQELLASLEAQEELDRAQARARGTSVMDSGYGTGSILSTDPAHPPLSGSESSTPSHARDPVQAGRNAWSGPIGDSVLFDPPSSMRSNEHEEDRFPDEDFDDLPLNELDSVVFQDGPEETPPLDSSRSRRETAAPSSLRRSSPPGLRASASGAHQDSDAHLSRSTAAKRPCVSSPGIPDNVLLLPDDDGDYLMDVDMDYCFPEEMDTPPRTSRDSAGAPSGPPLQEGDRNEAVSAPHPTETADRNPGPALVRSSASPVDVPGGVEPTVGRHRRPSGSAVVVDDDDDDDDDDAQTLASPPFTYLRLLQARWPRPQQRHGASVRVKAFIVTLLGKLTSAAGAWRVRATVSDGTGYLDVELSDQVLRGLLGFTVAQKCALKRDPGRRAELDAGMRRCQEEMVDMCAVMTLAFEEQGGKAVVTRVEPVTEEDLRALERRARRRETERRT